MKFVAIKPAEQLDLQVLHRTREQLVTDADDHSPGGRRRRSPKLAEKLPEGYTIEAGGTIEESAKGLTSIVAVFPLMIMLMSIILMVQLQSFQ
jgi:multidrug efflux pump subunit AcrB